MRREGSIRVFLVCRGRHFVFSEGSSVNLFSACYDTLIDDHAEALQAVLIGVWVLGGAARGPRATGEGAGKVIIHATYDKSDIFVVGGHDGKRVEGGMGHCTLST